MELLTEIIGYVAAAFGTALMLPQVYKSLVTKKADDISMVMLIVYAINCTLWEIYGLLIDSMPIILCNIIALMIGLFQIFLKIRFSKKHK